MPVAGIEGADIAGVRWNIGRLRVESFMAMTYGFMSWFAATIVVAPPATCEASDGEGDVVELSVC